MGFYASLLCSSSEISEFLKPLLGLNTCIRKNYKRLSYPLDSNNSPCGVFSLGQSMIQYMYLPGPKQNTCIANICQQCWVNIIHRIFLDLSSCHQRSLFFECTAVFKIVAKYFSKTNSVNTVFVLRLKIKAIQYKYF